MSRNPLPRWTVLNKVTDVDRRSGVLRGEVRRVTSAFIHTTSCARARALAPTFTSSLRTFLC